MRSHTTEDIHPPHTTPLQIYTQAYISIYVIRYPLTDIKNIEVYTNRHANITNIQIYTYIHTSDKHIHAKTLKINTDTVNG